MAPWLQFTRDESWKCSISFRRFLITGLSILSPSRRISMTFNDYLKQAWNDHAADAAKVADGFDAGLKLVEKPEHVAPMASLIVHVTGEHLAQWGRGIELLGSLRSNSTLAAGSEAEGAVARSIAALKVASGEESVLSSFTPSDRVRIAAIASSALASSQTTRATSLLELALKLAETSMLDAKDAAHRALAVTGHNLACALEEKVERSTTETQLMVLAAETSRKHWGLTGGWLEIERAEYRLANTFLKAGRIEEAANHAQACLEISKANSADELELFFANEAVAMVELARNQKLMAVAAVDEMKNLFAKMSADNQPWCKDSLEKLAARVAH